MHINAKPIPTKNILPSDTRELSQEVAIHDSPTSCLQTPGYCTNAIPPVNTYDQVVGTQNDRFLQIPDLRYCASLPSNAIAVPIEVP
jgi:hypothetical protein